jgi:hypothetical protein
MIMAQRAKSAPLGNERRSPSFSNVKANTTGGFTMSGFINIVAKGEHYGQSIINTFWYRCADWNPLAGNPFDDVLKVVDDFWDVVDAKWLGAHNGNYLLKELLGVGHKDDFSIVTSSPVIRTINANGALIGPRMETTGSSVSANLGFRLGDQVQINLVTKSLRNRGYISIGPVSEFDVDNYGHFSDGFNDALNQLGQVLDDVIIDIPLGGNFIPIRIHEVYTKPPFPKVLTGRTYSDVLGYRVPRVVSWRKSRRPEA